MEFPPGFTVFAAFPSLYDTVAALLAIVGFVYDQRNNAVEFMGSELPQGTHIISKCIIPRWTSRHPQACRLRLPSQRPRRASHVPQNSHAHRIGIEM